MNIIKRFFLFIVIFIFASCGNPDVSLVVKNKNSGKVFVDGKPISTKTIEISNHPNDVANYYLDLKKGEYNFKFYLQNGDTIEKTFNLQGGEAYLSVDLITGKTNGFGEINKSPMKKEYDGRNFIVLIFGQNLVFAKEKA